MTERRGRMDKQDKIKPLPDSGHEFWDGEVHVAEKKIKFPICKSHKNYMKHDGYRDNGDGTASCLICNWGFRMPGWIRIMDNKVIDLRKK